MADKDKPSEAADPVGTSFLAIADILDALSKVTPGIAGPLTAAAIDQIRTQWTPAPAATAPPPAPAQSHEAHGHSSSKHHHESAT